MTPRSIQPLSAEDREFLIKEQRAASPQGWRSAGGHLLVFLLGGALASVAALVVAAFLARLAGFRITGGAWQEHPVTFYGAIAVVAVVALASAISCLRWFSRSRQSAAAYRQAIRQDLEAGQVTVEEHSVLGVKLLQDPEHHAFIFLLRLSNGRTLVLYDHDSYSAESRAPTDSHPTIVARERISLRSFPASQRKRWMFDGAALPLPQPIALALDPAKWPEDESWCRVKWEDIERHYGPRTKPRQAAASRRS